MICCPSAVNKCPFKRTYYSIFGKECFIFGYIICCPFRMKWLAPYTVPLGPNLCRLVCLFPTLNSRMSENKCKLFHKVRNVQNLRHGSPNFRNYFFPNFTDNLEIFFKNRRPYYQNSFLKYIFWFSTLNSRMSRNTCNWWHKLCKAKTGVVPTFKWSNEALFNQFRN